MEGRSKESHTLVWKIEQYIEKEIKMSSEGTLTRPKMASEDIEKEERNIRRVKF